MTSGTRARWGGEARKIGTTQPSFGNLRLSAHRLESIVPQTRELIMSTKYSPPHRARVPDVIRGMLRLPVSRGMVRAPSSLMTVLL